MKDRESNPVVQILIGVLAIALFIYSSVRSFVNGWGDPAYGITLFHLLVTVTLSTLFGRSTARKEKILWAALLVIESLLLYPFFGEVFAADESVPAWVWPVSCWVLTGLALASMFRKTFPRKPPE